MTRTQMRAMLRRWLQEGASVAQQWSDATLNLYLDEGLKYMHRQVMKIDPEAIIYTATVDIVANQADYARPTNAQRDLYVYQRTSTTAAYALLDYVPYYKIAQLVAGDTVTGYARKGRFIVLTPTPTTAVAAGVKMEYIPTLSMATDAEVPDLIDDIHEGIVFRAAMLAYGDCQLPHELAEKELAAIITDLPLYYKATEQPKSLDLSGVTGWNTE